MDEPSAADENSITHSGENSAPTAEKKTMNCFGKHHENSSCR
jgi:hypothetical protein